jgi:heme-degrading monooxygenase HmoA
VIFMSERTAADDTGYAAAAQRMVELARQQPGFLGLESVRAPAGAGITISYWQSREAIRAWREHAEHRVAQAEGRARWYSQFRLQICRVEASRDFSASAAVVGGACGWGAD